MPAGAGNPPNIKMEPPKSNFNIRGGGGGSVLILGGRDYIILYYIIFILYYKSEAPGCLGFLCRSWGNGGSRAPGRQPKSGGKPTQHQQYHFDVSNVMSVTATSSIIATGRSTITVVNMLVLRITSHKRYFIVFLHVVLVVVTIAAPV